MKISLKLASIALAAATLGQATAVVIQMPPSFATSGTGLTASGGNTSGDSLGETVSNGGAYLSLFTGANGVTLTDSSLGLFAKIRASSTDTLTLMWTGTVTNNSAFAVNSPIDWLFNLGVSDPDTLASLGWTITVKEGVNTAYSNGNAFTSNPVQGASTFSVPSGVSNLEVDLAVSFTPLAKGDSVTVIIPQSGTINLGINSVPEPASFGFAAAGLIGLLSFARLRRRS